MYSNFIGMAAGIALFVCCGSHHSPKPRGYYRIALPQERSYTAFSRNNYPYSFEIHGIAQVAVDSDANSEPYWIDICYPQYNAKIHISYKDLRRDTLANLVEDMHYLVYKHTIKADAITEQEYVSDSSGVYGFFYDIAGDAASNIQFYLTDQKRHFLRGALYFNVHPNRDSLNPVILYIAEDIRHLMETTQWK